MAGGVSESVGYGMHAKIPERTLQIAVRIGDNELAVTGFDLPRDSPAAAALGDINPVPTLLHRHNDVGARCHSPSVHLIDILDAAGP